MTVSKILELIRPFSLLIAVGFGVLAVYFWWTGRTAQNELREAKSELALKIEQYNVLESKLALQNQAVETLNAQTKAAEARFERAAAAAESQNKKLDRTIAQLKAAKGTNCNDAMPLVDEIIRRS